MPRVKGGTEEKQRGKTNPGGGGGETEVSSHYYSLCLLSSCFSLSQCEATETLQILKSLHSTLGGRLTSAAAADEEETEREGDRGEEERQKAQTPRETISENPLTDAARKVNKKTKQSSNKKAATEKEGGKKQQRSGQAEGEVGGGGRWGGVCERQIRGDRRW